MRALGLFVSILQPTLDLKHHEKLPKALRKKERKKERS